MTNGSDAQFIDTYIYGGKAAIERGYNALLYEGPGQGSMLFERQIPMRPNWETVVTPIVDWLDTRSDVDTSRIALTGWSLGGNLVARAAAFEHRLACVVCDPGFLDLWQSFPSDFTSLFENNASASSVNAIWQTYAIPGLTPLEVFTVKKRSELYDAQFMQEARQGQVPQDGYLFGSLVQQYDVSDVIGKITSPTLVTNYQFDDLVASGQEEQTFAGLRSQKTFHTFTAEEGAEYHCAPMAPQRRNQVVFDWVGEHLG